MMPNASMAAKAEEYLCFRRSLGFRLKIEGQMLLHFAAYADAADHFGPLTTELALRWARATTSVDRLYAARRLEIVRSFARHLAVTEPGTEIPPRGLLGPAHRRNAPHIYSDAEISSLMTVAGQLGPPNGLRPQTYGTLIGLLAATGLRISEALHLNRADADLDQSWLIIRQTKFRKTRLVPLHPTAATAVQVYATARDRALATRRCDRFFVNDRGMPLAYSTVRHTFRQLCKRAAITGQRRYPRLHDMRHTFACRRIEAWYDAGIDLARALPALSAYLGHAKVSDTYWYLTATPDLLARAAKRFEEFTQTQRGREVKP